MQARSAGYTHNPESCHSASTTIAIGKINQRDVIGGVEECVCVSVSTCGGVGWGVCV